MKLNRALMLAVTAAIGSFLQGWVYVILTGFPTYMIEELNLETELVRDSFVWVVAMIGILLAIASGRIGGIGRRPLLILSSMLYLFSSVVMLLSRDLSLTLVARFLDGFAWGLGCILVPFYFMETYPRGFCRLLLTQLSSVSGLCLAFIVVVTPLIKWAGWKLMFNVAFGLSPLYFILVLFYLPESPKWLVRKGRDEEARHVLQTLRGSNDVSDEMYMLGYGLRLEAASSIEDLNDKDVEHGPDNLSKPVTASHEGSTESQNASLVDSLLTLSGNVDEESLTREGDDSMSNAADASVLTIRVSTN